MNYITNQATMRAHQHCALIVYLLSNFTLMDYCVIMVTTSSHQEAETIAETLVESKLAACVQIFPIQSIYTWHELVHNEPEFQLLIKTHRRQFEAIEAKIRELHSYEVSEIIALPIIAGSQPYLSWINEQLQNP
jgi:periplasmic divalent cation tolerance protein